MGSDTCSSVRGPSTVTNLVGLRPSIGAVSRDGIIPLSETQDTGGPMTRTVLSPSTTVW
ncbi:amidase family protein [Halovenus amylolytica]|uniref:amidase family protein n=1 Tax=Halovenus amylolytica TaxID=2500550 RepID=UPI003D6BCA79